MFYSPIFSPALSSLARRQAALATRNHALNHAACATPRTQVTQDDGGYSLSLDVPGVTKEQLQIQIEGQVVRVSTVDDAPRTYRAAWELPQDIDAATSVAKLDNGVLTLKLTKKPTEIASSSLVIH